MFERWVVIGFVVYRRCFFLQKNVGERKGGGMISTVYRIKSLLIIT